MKKIGIDISQTIYGTGVSNFTADLVDSILKMDSTNRYVLFGSSFRGFFKLKNLVSKYPQAKACIYPFPIRVFEFFFHKLNLPIELFCPGVDIFHCSDWLTPRSRKVKIVVPVYDLTTKIAPSDHTSKTVSVHELRMARAIKYAKFITFLSQSTRKDFFDFYNFDLKKTAVIYPSTNIFKIKPEDFSKIKHKFGINKPYILSVSTLQPRKNLPTLIKAYEKIKDRDEYQLVIVGPKGWGNVSIVPDKNIIQTGFVTNSELASLYKNANIFVYPSYYEGFGLPIIEAMSFGIPTICADTSSMPEAGGTAAIYFSPNKPSELVSKITELNSLNADNRKSLFLKSRDNVKRFSWSTSAKKIIDIYEKL